MSRSKSKSKEPPNADGLLQPADFKDLQLGGAVYRSVRQAIATGRFKPGDRLREVTIANLLNVSRTPVRDALKRLESEGLLTIAPSRGLIVTELDRQNVLELYGLREILEGSAAALAANRASESEILALFEILEEEANHLDDASKLAEINRHFHSALYAASHNRYLIAAASGLSRSLHLLPGTTLSVPGRAVSSHEEHIEIVSHIEQRNPATAEQIARKHIREARRLRLRMLFTYGS